LIFFDNGISNLTKKRTLGVRIFGSIIFSVGEGFYLTFIDTILFI